MSKAFKVNVTQNKKQKNLIIGLSKKDMSIVHLQLYLLTKTHNITMTFKKDLIIGLSKKNKSIPSKYHYDLKKIL